MKTAVEWFEEQVGHASLMALKEFNEIFEQAKEMEKEQIKDLVIDTYVDLKMKNNKLPYGIDYLNKLASVSTKAEKYYNETFKQQEQ